MTARRTERAQGSGLAKSATGPALASAVTSTGKRAVGERDSNLGLPARRAEAESEIPF
jgi:hypothetical protein